MHIIIMEEDMKTARILYLQIRRFSEQYSFHPLTAASKTQMQRECDRLLWGFSHGEPSYALRSLVP